LELGFGHAAEIGSGFENSSLGDGPLWLQQHAWGGAKDGGHIPIGAMTFILKVIAEEDSNSDHRNSDQHPILDTNAENAEVLNKHMHGYFTPLAWPSSCRLFVGTGSRRIWGSSPQGCTTARLWGFSNTACAFTGTLVAPRMVVVFPVSPVPRCIEGASLAGVASRFKVGTYDQCSLVQRVDGDGLQLTEISIPRAIEFSFNFRDPPQVALSLLSIIEIEKRDVKTLGIELALISNPVECVDLQ
jgi:hypothetical protein